MATPIDLAAGCKLPAAVAERCTHTETVGHEKVLRTAHLKTEATFAVAPYQAMPVAGPVITHNRAPALDVLAPSDELPQEVRAGLAAPARRAAPAAGGATDGRVPRRSWRTA
jgi:histidine decarboxylase